METTTGCRLLDLHDTVQSTAIPLAVLYPAVAPERTLRFGPYTLDLAPDAPPVGAALPLVVLSHGNGGTPWAYRDLAKHLARAGFVVALPEHPGNSRTDTASPAPPPTSPTARATSPSPKTPFSPTPPSGPTSRPQLSR